MTAAISDASIPFSSACWRMMSSWRSGRVSSWIAWSTLPTTPSRTPDEDAGRDHGSRRPPPARRRPMLGLHPLSFSTSADSACSRSSSVPSFSITWSARSAFSAWSSWRASRSSTRAWPRASARARAHLVGGDHRDAGVEDALHPGLEEQRHLDHGDLGLVRQRGEQGADPLADQRVDLGLEPGELLGVGEDDLADAGAVDLPPGRDVVAPALGQAAEQRFGLEQLVDDRVAGDRRRAEALEGGQRG